MRRSVRFGLLAICVCAFAVAAPASAQTYPGKPVRIIVPFPPDGTSDIPVRSLGQKLIDEWKQQGAPPAMTDLLAGQVMLTFATAPSTGPFVKSGRLRALGVSAAQRISALPDVPTIAEAGVPGFEAAGWNGLVGPAGMPAALVRQVHDAVTKIIWVPAMSAFLESQGADPHTMTPGEFGGYIKSEKREWDQVVKASGARVD